MTFEHRIVLTGFVFVDIRPNLWDCYSTNSYRVLPHFAAWLFRMVLLLKPFTLILKIAIIQIAYMGAYATKFLDIATLESILHALTICRKIY